MTKTLLGDGFFDALVNSVLSPLIESSAATLEELDRLCTEAYHDARKQDDRTNTMALAHTISVLARVVRRTLVHDCVDHGTEGTAKEKPDQDQRAFRQELKRAIDTNSKILEGRKARNADAIGPIPGAHAELEGYVTGLNAALSLSIEATGEEAEQSDNPATDLAGQVFDELDDDLTGLVKEHQEMLELRNADLTSRPYIASSLEHTISGIKAARYLVRCKAENFAQPKARHTAEETAPEEQEVPAKCKKALWKKTSDFPCVVAKWQGYRLVAKLNAVPGAEVRPEKIEIVFESIGKDALGKESYRAAPKALFEAMLTSLGKSLALCGDRLEFSDKDLLNDWGAALVPAFDDNRQEEGR